MEPWFLATPEPIVHAYPGIQERKGWHHVWHLRVSSTFPFSSAIHFLLSWALFLRLTTDWQETKSQPLRGDYWDWYWAPSESMPLVLPSCYLFHLWDVPLPETSSMNPHLAQNAQWWRLVCSLGDITKTSKCRLAALTLKGKKHQHYWQNTLYTKKSNFLLHEHCLPRHFW